MKILQIHIHNIASLIDVQIDFTQQPLSDSDVFLITGNIGSGKSTILDSICLALYNTTPRLCNRKSINVANNDDNITLDDPRRMMRRGTGEAYVRLTFTGSDGKEYLAEWQVQRGLRKKPEAQLSNTTWSIKNCEDGSITTGAKNQAYKDVAGKIQEVVGLDFNQFCRTTMLAQGEFTRFIKSDEKEKANILEKLTQFTQYSQAGRLIFETTRAKKQAWEKAKADAGDNGMNEEQLQEKNHQMEVFRLEEKTKNKEKKTVDDKLLWLKKEMEIRAQKEGAQKQLLSAREQMESDDFRQKRTFVDQWKETISVRQNWNARTKAEKEQAEAQRELERIREEFLRTLEGRNELNRNIAKQEEHIKQLADRLEAESNKAEVYRNAQTITSLLSNLTKGQKDKKEIQDQLAKARTDLDQDYTPKLQKCKAELEVQEGACRKADEEIKEQEQKLNALQLSRLQEEQVTLTRLLGYIQVARQEANNFRQKTEERKQEQERLTNLKKELDQKKKELEERGLPALQAAERKLKEAEEVRDRLKDSADTFAAQLRSRLTVGCTCPVCQQTVKALPIEKELQNLYKEADQAYQATKQQKVKTESSYNQEKSKWEANTSTYNHDLNRWTNDTSVDKAQQKAEEAYALCSIDKNNDPLVALNTKESQATHRLDEEIKPKLRQGEELQKLLAELRNRKNNEDKKKEELSHKQHESEQACSNTKTKIEELNQRNIQEDKNIAETQQQISDWLGTLMWNANWQTQTAEFIQELVDAAKRYDENARAKEKEENLLQRQQEVRQQVTEIIHQIREEHKDWKNLETEEHQTIEALTTHTHQVHTHLTSVTNKQKRAEEDYRQHNRCVEEYLANNHTMTIERLAELDACTQENINVSDRFLQNICEMVARKTEVLRHTEEEYAKHQTQKPMLNEKDRTEVLNDLANTLEGEIQRINQQIGALTQELEEDRKKKEKQKDLNIIKERAEKEYNKWERLNKILGDAEGTTFQKIAQSYILDGLLASANEYLRKLEPRYTLKTVPGTLHISLEDAYQGYNTRSTDSLSGGESFLVSLALALALSDIGHNLAVDTLFIDEGFGTLSGIPLTNAINTLRTLNSQNGRHVGIISHIQEVRDNIPIQIQVEQTANNSSSTIRIVETHS